MSLEADIVMIMKSLEKIETYVRNIIDNITKNVK